MGQVRIPGKFFNLSKEKKIFWQEGFPNKYHLPGNLTWYPFPARMGQVRQLTFSLGHVRTQVFNLSKENLFSWQEGTQVCSRQQCSSSTHKAHNCDMWCTECAVFIPERSLPCQQLWQPLLHPCITQGVLASDVLITVLGIPHSSAWRCGWTFNTMGCQDCCWSTHGRDACFTERTAPTMLVALSLACGKITAVDGCEALPYILLKRLPRQPFQPKAWLTDCLLHSFESSCARLWRIHQLLMRTPWSPKCRSHLCQSYLDLAPASLHQDAYEIWIWVRMSYMAIWHCQLVEWEEPQRHALNTSNSIMSETTWVTAIWPHTWW